MPSGPMDARSMSPTYAAFVMQQAAQTMSPTFEMYRNFPFGPASPSSLFQGSGVGTATPKGNPLAAATMMRNMQNAAAAAAASPHPLNSINQMRLPQMGSPITSMASNLAQQPSSNSRGSANNTKTAKSESKPPKVKEQHIKKPLNAFMWFMKENRPKLMEELDYKERQSAELNKELGRRWHDLPKEEQQRYYELAKTDREQHMQKYPGWSARENYAINKKKKRKRDKSIDNGEQKKCRARFGVVNQDQWCKHCKRKKRCLWYREASSPVGVVSSTTPGTPGTPSSLSGPVAGGVLSGRDTDSENDMDAAAAAAAERSRSMLNQMQMLSLAVPPTMIQKIKAYFGDRKPTEIQTCRRCRSLKRRKCVLKKYDFKIGNAKSANDGPVGRVSKVINFDSIREGPDPVVDLQAFFLRKLTGNIGTSASPTREKRESVRESALYTWGRGDTRHNSIT
uniref:dTCF n=1 Tax=Loa loa TaxID=7209 RepID=A0A1I7VY09_LOALO